MIRNVTKNVFFFFYVNTTVVFTIVYVSFIGLLVITECTVSSCSKKPILPGADWALFNRTEEGVVIVPRAATDTDNSTSRYSSRIQGYF